MSEYQYYEFHAIDRPLNKKEMDELRSFSTRARISPTSFVNDYSWGSFKGDEDKWMERYFDAYLYLANWGTHVFKLRLPAKLLPAATANHYCVGDTVFAKEKDGKIVISFISEAEPGDWEEGEGWLSSLIPIRAELARGDLRALYIGWLLCAQNGQLDDDASEPPVPPNLAALSASLQSLVEFLRIDEDILDVAAEGSAKTQDEPADKTRIAAWISGLSAASKDEILVRLMMDGNPQLQNELLARYDREGKQNRSGIMMTEKPRPRTVAELLALAETRTEVRRQADAKKAAEEKARRERAAALAREKYLDALAGRESNAWTEIDQLIATKQPKSYDRALELLVDLRDVAGRKSCAGEFTSRVGKLRTMHAQKPSLIKRLRDAGL